MSLKGRLERLEVSAAASHEDYEVLLSRKVLGRMTDEELDAYEAALRRAVETGGEFAEGDFLILKRAQELYEEVRNELEAPT